eukprot:m.168515 g.168515  ORF g.168515 m.168515 type:complete len:57 (-) comp14479_c1_seq3:1131-1301(-)
MNCFCMLLQIDVCSLSSPFFSQAESFVSYYVPIQLTQTAFHIDARMFNDFALMTFS